MQILRNNQKVFLESSGVDCKVGDYIGCGSQGEVFRVHAGDKDLALKWYFPQNASQEQKKVLRTLIRKGPPNKNFLWPLDMVSAPSVEGFGYVMPLREERYKSIIDLLMSRIDPSFRSLTTAGFELADSFLKLHMQGLCYRDISYNNVFFDPATGEILVCDNDNVALDGVDLGIGGTPRFMAPEIVRGEATPSTQTDLFSLAVLLFYMFMIHHPLEGQKELDIRCFDMPAMKKLYGTEPIFIYDPSNISNRPIPGHHDNALEFWPLYPQSLRDLFIKAFTCGIHDPQHGRIRESQWRAAMVNLRDSICYCQHCRSQNFYDVTVLKAGHGNAITCWSCNRAVTLPWRMRLGNIIIMLNYDTKLYPHHINDDKMYDFSEPIGEITTHPQNPSIWGLKNTSQDKWVCTCNNGMIKDVAPGRSIGLESGLKIYFGKNEGEIHC